MLANDLFFQTIIALIVPAVVGLLLVGADRIGLIWAKLNQPTIAAIVGAFIAAGYHVPAVYAGLHNGKVPDGSLADFIQAGVIAGLAGAGAMSVVKDVRSGAYKTNSEAGVIDMRNRNDSKDGIGS